jgi:serine/threonine protein kinase
VTDRWQRLSSIYHGALGRGIDERAAYLTAACGSDAALRREVESLLAQSAAPGSLLDTPASAPRTSDRAEPPGGLVGRQVGVYTLEAFIGAGGMGEVYRARDSRLHRDVAIKFSAERFSERFQREAEIIAQLNHPHICTLFDVGPNYLVMEYLHGRPLEGPLPLGKVLEYAAQICGALDYAHRSGVVHRDLKPANILVTRHGVKLLDFGIARMPGKDATLTKPGEAVGTPLFMAPELWEGKSGDSRSDVFALGRVLSYMANGSTAGDRPLDSSPLERVVRTCLAPDPDDRWQTPREVNIALESLRQAAPVKASAARAWLPWTVAGLALLVAAVVSFVAFQRTPDQAPVLRATMAPPERTTFADMAPAVSPDGRRLAFVASQSTVLAARRIWVRAIDSLDAQPLAGTDGAEYPFWSADSRSIGFFAAGKLKTISASGGPLVVVADAPSGRGGSWNHDGVIVFASANSGPLLRVQASGGPATPVTAIDLANTEGSHRWPWFLPDGRHFLYLATSGGRTSLRVGSLDAPSSTAVAEGVSNGVYSEGHLLFLQGGTLMAQPFDVRRFVTTGGVVPVDDYVQRTDRVGGGVFSASTSGLLVYRKAAARSQFTWFDRGGTRLSTFGEPFVAGGRMQFSPDRRHVAVSVRNPVDDDRSIWVYDVPRGIGSRFTFDPAPELVVAWSPDGQTLAFSSARRGRADLYRRRRESAGPDELIYADDTTKYPTSWSRDGKFLLFHSDGNVWVLPDPLGPPGGSKPIPFLRDGFTNVNAQFAPIGGLVLYESNESGRTEVYVTKFPGPGAKQKISTTGGAQGRWSPRGNEIFYVAPDGALMSAQWALEGDGLAVREVSKLFNLPIVSPEDSYDVSADGQRFLAVIQPPELPSEPLVFLQNWTRAAKK